MLNRKCYYLLKRLFHPAIGGMDLPMAPSHWRAPSNTSHRPELIWYAQLLEYIPAWLVQKTKLKYSLNRYGGIRKK